MQQHIMIPCYKYGGVKPAVACCVNDRYRFCRKRCKPLEEKLQENPSLKEDADKYAVEKRPRLFTMSFVNKNLPSTKSELRCHRCGFIAKTPRGLKTHMTRNHKKTGKP